MNRPNINTHSHFLNESVIEVSYMPEELKHRDHLLDELHHAASPGLRGVQPQNLIIRGLPGTGKTTAIRKVFSELDALPGAIVPVYVNCLMIRTQFGVFSEIFRALSDGQSYPLNRSLQKITMMINGLMKKKNCTLLVCLDDVNYLADHGELNETLYSLLRFHEIHGEAKIGVWAATSDMTFDLFTHTDGRVQSVFMPKEVFFHPYGRDEIAEILHDRVKKGLRYGFITNGAFEMLVDAGYDSGDLRTSLILLRRSAYLAEDLGSDLLDEWIVRQVLPHSNNFTEEKVAETLRPREMELLALIKELARTGMELSMSAVFSEVKERIGCGYSVFFKTVNRLEKAGMIRTEMVKGRGRKRVIVVDGIR